MQSRCCAGSARLGNRKHRLTSITQDGAPWGHYTYDPRGNMIDKTGQTLVFDRASRLTQIPNVANYEYDGHGRRTSQWRADGTVRVSLYTLDGRLQGEADNRAVGSTDYMYLGSTLVAKRFQPWSGSPPVVTYQHSDGLGSPVLETDANGAVVSRERFLSYGGAVDGAVNDTIGYTGHQEDPASGLVYMQQRYYDPVTGRFLSIDPVAANATSGLNFNRYWYANSSPYKFTDPDGRLAGFAGWFQDLAGMHRDEPTSRREANENFAEEGAALVDPIAEAALSAKGTVGSAVEAGTPDYVQASGGAYFASGEFAYTRDGTILVGGSVALNPASDGKKGGSILYGFLFSTPYEGATDDFVQGGSITYGGCFTLCLGFAFNTAGSAVLVGSGTPQLWLPSVAGMEPVVTGLPSY